MLYALYMHHSNRTEHMTKFIVSALAGKGSAVCSAVYVWHSVFIVTVVTYVGQLDRGFESNCHFPLRSDSCLLSKVLLDTNNSTLPPQRLSNPL